MWGIGPSAVDDAWITIGSANTSRGKVKDWLGKVSSFSGRKLSDSLHQRNANPLGKFPLHPLANKH
jgi:hypothetical protein